MTLVRFEVLAAKRFGALVYPALLCANEEKVLALAVEIEAKAASQTGEGGFIVRARNQLQLHHLLAFELVLHQEPIRHSPIRGDGKEVQCAARLVVVPTHLPYRVGVLVGSHGALVYGLLHARSDVVDQHSAIVEADGQHCGVVWMPIQCTHACVRVEDILREARVLQGVTTYHASALPEEVVRAEADSAKIIVPGVPLDGRHLLPLRLLGRETPQGQQRSFAVS
mmetsp:Transcript_18374/g.50417  ORF Transcript_18374/g.50417 Transcript_18374/m.50417 type:complete len:225 (+) Transcript_18374:612-1286(+)